MELINFFYALKGKCVKLTLRSSTYVGFVHRINPNKTLVFVDVADDGCKILGSKLFFGREILNVEIVHEDRTYNGTAQSYDGPVAQKEYMEKIMLDDEENEEDCMNFVVVDEFQGKFVPAVAHIKRQHAIGVGADGIELFKNGRLCWLQIATKHKIYLFDILLLGARAFKNGLCQILGNKHILKIIHNCRVIASSLNCQFGVKLTNVFDTQVADVLYFYSETGGFLPDRVSTLEEVASLHLKIPSSQVSALQMKSKLGQEEMHLWQKRPCPVPLLRLMALSVTHLMPLRLALIHTFMTDYMTLVDSYLESSYFEPDELSYLNMESALALPDELRKLEQMHCERQQRAREHYAITEGGLLARFGPQPSPEMTRQEDKKAESHQPEMTGQEDKKAESHQPTKPPASVKGCPAPAHQPVSPRTVTAHSPFNIIVSPDSVGQDPKPTMTARTDLQSANISTGMAKRPLERLGRGRLFEQQQTPTPAQSAGRGFLLHMSQAQVSRYSPSA